MGASARIVPSPDREELETAQRYRVLGSARRRSQRRRLGCTRRPSAAIPFSPNQISSKQQQCHSDPAVAGEESRILSLNGRGRETNNQRCFASLNMTGQRAKRCDVSHLPTGGTGVGFGGN